MRRVDSLRSQPVRTDGQQPVLPTAGGPTEPIGKVGGRRLLACHMNTPRLSVVFGNHENDIASVDNLGRVNGTARQARRTDGDATCHILIIDVETLVHLPTLFRHD